jgi:hypothetical protein
MCYSDAFGGCVYARRCDGSCPPGTVSNDKTTECAVAPGPNNTCGENAEYNPDARGCVLEELARDPNGPHYPWFPGFPYPGYPGQPGWHGGNFGGYPYFPYWQDCGRHCGCGGFTPFGYGYGYGSGGGGYYGGYNGYGAYDAGGYQERQSYAQSTNPYLNIAAQSMGYSV